MTTINLTTKINASKQIVFDVLFLKKHLMDFLLERNKVLKEVSEKND